MQLVVVATPETQKELQEKGLPEGAEVHFEITVANAKTSADAYFYPLPEENLDSDEPTLQAFQKPIFVNAVVNTLSNLPAGFIRINGWPGFVQRSVLEVCATEADLEIAKSILNTLDWKHQIVPDIPGMISARVISMIVNEAYFALEDEVSTKEEIDLAMKLGTNYPLGPFEWSEQIGLENIYELLSVLSENDPRYTPSPLMTKEINS